MEYLFQVSIGPVQSFIASARKTQDLRFGSQLLSELAKAVAKRIVDESEQNILIFPATLNNREIAKNGLLNVANKIVAIVSEPVRVNWQVVIMYPRKDHATVINDTNA